MFAVVFACPLAIHKPRITSRRPGQRFIDLSSPLHSQVAIYRSPPNFHFNITTNITTTTSALQKRHAQHRSARWLAYMYHVNIEWQNQHATALSTTRYTQNDEKSTRPSTCTVTPAPTSGRQRAGIAQLASNDSNGARQQPINDHCTIDRTRTKRCTEHRLYRPTDRLYRLYRQHRKRTEPEHVRHTYIYIYTYIHHICHRPAFAFPPAPTPISRFRQDPSRPTIAVMADIACNWQHTSRNNQR